MQLGMIGLGRMGGNMVRRLMRGGHEVIVYSATAKTRETFAKETGPSRPLPLLSSSPYANVGKKDHSEDAETTPLRDPEHYQYDFNLAEVTELWRRGSVMASWLLDLCALEFAESPDLSKFAGRVSDSGEGRWTILAALDEGAPAPVLSTALYQRFSSRGEDDFARKVLSAMRFGFGGHLEKPAK